MPLGSGLRLDPSLYLGALSASRLQQTGPAMIASFSRFTPAARPHRARDFAAAVRMGQRVAECRREQTTSTTYEQIKHVSPPDYSAGGVFPTLARGQRRHYLPGRQ